MGNQGNTDNSNFDQLGETANLHFIQLSFSAKRQLTDIKKAERRIRSHLEK
jgi:hypothetical protein